MNKIEGGTVNSLFRTDGIVVKYFERRNGIDTPAQNRMMAEYLSMKRIDIAPTFRGFANDGICMSFVNGEKYLDSAIDTFPEAVRMGIYKQSGEKLAHIHAQNQQRITSPIHHEAHLKRVYDLVDESRPYTRSLGIDPLNLLDGLIESYDPKEIEKRGLTWIHGDYWLSNYIGRRVNGRFDLEGVIDWEGAKLTTPYEDFAVALMSIEQAHPESSVPFWKGYGLKPKPQLQSHFAALKTLEWMISDEEGQETNFTTPFYVPKVQIIQQLL